MTDDIQSYKAAADYLAAVESGDIEQAVRILWMDKARFARVSDLSEVDYINFLEQEAEGGIAATLEALEMLAEEEGKLPLDLMTPYIIECLCRGVLAGMVRSWNEDATQKTPSV